MTLQAPVNGSSYDELAARVRLTPSEIHQIEKGNHPLKQADG